MTATDAVEQSSAPGSDQREALDSHVEAERAAMPAFLDANPGLYSDVRIAAKAPDSIIFTYVYATPMDPAKATAYFDSMVPTFQGLLESQVFPDMRSAGVTGAMSASYVYVNADGSQLWKKEFPSS